MSEVPKEETVVAEQQSGIRIGEKLYDSPDDFTIGEAEVIKTNTGLSPQDLIVGVQDDPTDPTFLRAIAWVVLHRANAKVEWDDKQITEASVGMFFAVPEQEEDANPPASRQKRSSSAKPTTSSS